MHIRLRVKALAPGKLRFARRLKIKASSKLEWIFMSTRLSLKRMLMGVSKPCVSITMAS